MKIKKIGSIVLILIGAIALIYEMASVTKNYYVQSAGIIALMFGLFLVNSTLTSRTENNQEEHFEEE